MINRKYIPKFNLTSGNWLEQAGFHLLPNLFTFSALFSAFFAIVEAINGRYQHAGWAMVACLLLDGMDGRVARYTGAQGRFGEEIDSIADMVSFGVTPALLAYVALLKPLGYIGFAIAFFYCACTAFRLALFNSLIETVSDKRWFMGVPSPSAASMLVGFIWVWSNYFSDWSYQDLMAAVLTLFAAVSMIVPVFFWSFKGLKNPRNQRLNDGFLLLILLLLFVTKPAIVLFGFFFSYILVGYGWAYKRYLDKQRNFPL